MCLVNLCLGRDLCEFDKRFSIYWEEGKSKPADLLWTSSSRGGRLFPWWFPAPFKKSFYRIYNRTSRFKCAGLGGRDIVVDWELLVAHHFSIFLNRAPCSTRWSGGIWQTVGSQWFGVSFIKRLIFRLVEFSWTSKFPAWLLFSQMREEL